ncbi:unnamed protein product [Rotaria socialis]|nr:unnamed protein product [Rotaria socialis]CAF3429371.1 unnamed protein product [Rotaria socialis]CAF4379429.1 unnamed protein product [Rotaria socialis]CAF4834928.1 unnamed protein product [Rotaria socialis]
MQTPTQLSTELQEKKRQEETFIQPSLPNRLPNDYVSSSDIRQILYLDDKKPYIHLNQRPLDHSVENQFCLESQNSNEVTIQLQSSLTQTHIPFLLMNLTEPPRDDHIDNPSVLQLNYTNDKLANSTNEENFDEQSCEFQFGDEFSLNRENMTP